MSELSVTANFGSHPTLAPQTIKVRKPLNLNAIQMEVGVARFLK